MAFCVQFCHNLCYIIGLLIIIHCNVFVNGYDAEDFEVFDLVEEVGKNFYEVLDVPKDASASALRKAYHRLSLQLHPDHNKEDNAEETFRQLVGIYEILKDETKRKKYDNVLEVGLPDWRQPAFYYRRVRKFGIVELAIILFFILTLGQYLVSWSVYLERKYEFDEVISSKLKKQRDKKLKKGKGSDNGTITTPIEELYQIPKPRCTDLLPFMMFRGTVSLIRSVPSFCLFLRELMRNALKRNEPVRSEGDDRSETNEEKAEEEEERVKKPRRRKVYEIPEKESESKDEEEVSSENVPCKPVKPVYQNRIWFDDDIAALTKAMNKVPVGTNGRWDLIGDMLKRPVSDVTRMAKTLKLNTGPKQVSAALQGITGEHFELSEEKSGNHNEDNWTQTQQKALELALGSYPKGCEERWDRIAGCVPDKTKEECIVRYKQLVEVVKKKRQS